MQTLYDVIALLQEHRPGWRPQNLVDVEYVAFVAGFLCSCPGFNAEDLELLGEQTLEQALRERFDRFQDQVNGA